MDTAERAAFEAALRGAGEAARKAKAVIVWAEWRDGQLSVRTRRLGRGEPAPGAPIVVRPPDLPRPRRAARGVQGQLL